MNHNSAQRDETYYTSSFFGPGKALEQAYDSMRFLLQAMRRILTPKNQGIKGPFICPVQWRCAGALSEVCETRLQFEDSRIP
jgi:hypothetical protein